MSKNVIVSSAAEYFMAAAQSAATKRAYASDLRHFLANGGCIPASPAVLVEYLARHARSLAVATLERRLAAIHQTHIELAVPSPVQDPNVKRTMQGIRRTLKTPQRQAKALLRDDLLRVLDVAARQKPMKAARDRALLLTGWAGAFRRSELVAIRVEHLTKLPHGVQIFLPSSKTDQEGHGRFVVMLRTSGRSCPVSALLHWMELAGIRDGYVFRSVNRHDQVARNTLSAQAVALVVKASVHQVNGDAVNMSGHSLRAGFCSQAALDGLQSWQIKVQTGHKSDGTLSKYIRLAQRGIPSLL